MVRAIGSWVDYKKMTNGFVFPDSGCRADGNTAERGDRVPVSEPWMPPNGGTLRLQEESCGGILYEDLLKIVRAKVLAAW
jgi:hypothetical protein